MNPSSAPTTCAPTAGADPSRVDDADLRADRRRRLFAAMADHDLDVLVLCRPAEVAFATGARQLWTAGTRPFGPAAIAVRETGRTHLLSVSDHEVPPEVSHDDLFGLSWNPATLAASVAAVPGLARAIRIGTTSSSAGFDRLIATVAPGAGLVDGGPALWAARMPKSDAEVDRIAAAVGIAEAGLDAMAAALAPGVTERELCAVHLEAIAAAGAPTPPTEAVAWATPTRGPVALRRVASPAPIEAGQLVALDAGAFFRGYEGGLGRTAAVTGVANPQRRLGERARRAVAAVVDVCRPGATGSDLLDAWRRTGEAPPPVPLAHGVGLGVEPPIVGTGVGAGARLDARTVLSITGWVAEEGTGGVLVRDLVLIDEAGPFVLTTRGRALVEGKG